ncbi:alpha/beta hydrolase [Rhodoblastus sp.]|jgi:esterase/lipase superfamily enzyme|uniref:alpha/beta hydrolase n=1 Tax=Rhodoblastus sp. TaxID=1962975 RepID=UPI0025E07A63|nr:alpha/beta hydrolase [Rhodoblastus sp.]
MPLRLAVILALLCLAAPAGAAEIRLAVPSAFAEDIFVKSLLASKILAGAGVTVAPKPVASDAEALAALEKGEADLAVFALDGENRRALQNSGAATTLLTRPFMFKSAEEVFLMQDSFLGMAATADASRSGLFPLKIWTHSIAYLLTHEPIRSEEDFARLKVAAEDGAPDARILSAAGAHPAGAMSAMGRDGANAIETHLGDEISGFAASMNGKLYLTIGWQETGLLAAAPDSWRRAREIEKNAIKTAAEQARADANSGLMARQAAFLQAPNVEFNQLEHGAQMELAMRAGGGGEAAMTEETALWRKAEIEVHGQTPAATAAGPKMARNSPVLFATDRNDEKMGNLATRFGARRLDPFEFSCGYLGSPARHSGEPSLPAAPLSLVKGVEDCAREIVARTRAAGASKILFVIHGFNIDFSGLMWRALQVASDLDYDGAIVGWSWPSEGSAFSYAYDEDSNAWSEPHLAELVSEIAAIAPDFQIDFVAHSMGNRILLQMLREFAQAKSSIRIGAAVFAAPDISQDVFREQLRQARKIGALRTLYASEYDRAILISESYHKAPRAGSGGANILVTGGVESVDTRLSGHSYVFDEPKAIEDFRKIVNRETAATGRGLPAREKAGAAYWVIEP